MARHSEDKGAIRRLSHTRQVAFHQLLVAARKSWLLDALKDAVRRVPQKIVKEQMLLYAPAESQQILAAAGIRDEHVFPVPRIIEAKPSLVGYYRLLLGVPQKTFYGTGTQMGPFKNMETRGVINPARRPDLEWFCETMGKCLGDLVLQMSPRITSRDVSELPILTLGSQFQGGNNNSIGKKATIEVFRAVSELVQGYVKQENEKAITLENDSGRTVTIALASDPDIRIQEVFQGRTRNKVAIEIKGGSDRSNAHNRAGEAEKSHQKAKKNEFRDYWTLISTAGLRIETLKAESPTISAWFDVAQILAREGHDWRDFCSRLAEAAGIHELAVNSTA